jgi:hypothetical protein
MSIVKKMLADTGPEQVFAEARRVARDYTYRLRSEGRLSFSEPSDRHLTTIHIVRRTLAEVWEDTFMALMGIGQEIHTHYDPTARDGDFVSFPSLEATVMMHIEDPFGEPRFHKHYLGGWMGFGDYRAEIEGVKDGWMISPAAVADAMRNGTFEAIKDDERWNYMYSQRMRAYPYFDFNGELNTVQQLKQVVRNLKANPSSRSAQCITWDPRWDHNDAQMGPFKWASYHSPCLQRFWFRLQRDTAGAGYRMNVNGHWRSRDHLKAVPANIFGVTEGMHEEVRRDLEEALDAPVAWGSYIDISDSLHLYGHYLDPRLQGLDAESYLEDIFRIASGEPISERVILPDTPMYAMMCEDIEREYRFRTENPDKGKVMR